MRQGWRYCQQTALQFAEHTCYSSMLLSGPRVVLFVHIVRSGSLCVQNDASLSDTAQTKAHHCRGNPFYVKPLPAIVDDLASHFAWHTIQLLGAVTIHSFLQPTFQFRCVGSPQFQHPRVSKAVGSVDPTFHARPSALGATKPTCDDSAAIVEAAGSCLETRARVPSKRGSDSRACSGFLSAVIVLYLWPPC